MIGVKRPMEPPRILTGRGAAERDRVCAEFDEAPADYQSGTKTLSFKSAIYGAPSVKKALCACQHDKCAFCESKVSESPPTGYVPSRGSDQGNPAAR